MATFAACILKGNKKSDGTWQVNIRLSHNRKNRYIGTTMYVSKKDLTSSLKIKNQIVLDKCADLIKAYRERLYKLNLELVDMDIDSIIESITQPVEQRTILFTAWSEKWLEQRKNISSTKNYRTAVNALMDFMQRTEILMSEINTKNMQLFAEWLSDRPRAASLYTNAIVKIFNDAREYYNDEDNDIIRIKHSLRSFKAPQQNVAKKRAISVESVRAIMDIPFNENDFTRTALARDCFILSFCLMGMNSADLYNATDFNGEYITYQRTKTKGRRSDNAEISVKVHEYIMPIMRKYKGTSHVFSFSERYKTMADLNRAINIGLKEIGNEIGEKQLQFYAARHSMASIAVNDVRIDKHIVHEMLNHVEPSMKITDLYIIRDFSQINEANMKLINFILDR